MRIPLFSWQVFVYLFFLQWGILMLDKFLQRIVAARGAWRVLRYTMRQPLPSSPYDWLLAWILLASLLDSVVVGPILWGLGVPLPVLYTFLQWFYLGLMLLLIVGPMLGPRGLPRYFACTQGLVLTIVGGVWPELIARPYSLWGALGSLLCYILLFVLVVVRNR